MPFYLFLIHMYLNDTDNHKCHWKTFEHVPDVPRENGTLILII